MLYDVCLREWSEKVNSCFICCQIFYVVMVYDRIGGKFVFFFLSMKEMYCLLMYFFYQVSICLFVELRIRSRYLSLIYRCGQMRIQKKKWWLVIFVLCVIWQIMKRFFYFVMDVMYVIICIVLVLIEFQLVFGFVWNVFIYLVLSLFSLLLLGMVFKRIVYVFCIIFFVFRLVCGVLGSGFVLMNGRVFGVVLLVGFGMFLSWIWIIRMMMIRLFLRVCVGYSNYEKEKGRNMNVGSNV